jgi:polyisoprenoid-binding protein YceI
MRTEAATHFTLVPSGIWQIDAGCSTVGFEVRHLKLLHIRGRFHDVSAELSCDEEGSASIAASIDVESVDTGDPRRDTRLCAHEFFDVEHHPSISFDGVLSPSDEGDAPVVQGTMSIRGVRRPLELRVLPSRSVDGDGERERRFGARGVVSRREFGLDWDPAFAVGGLVIDDRVGLRLDVVFRRAQSS